VLCRFDPGVAGIWNSPGTVGKSELPHVMDEVFWSVRLPSSGQNLPTNASSSPVRIHDYNSKGTGSIGPI